MALGTRERSDGRHQTGVGNGHDDTRVASARRTHPRLTSSCSAAGRNRGAVIPNDRDRRTSTRAARTCDTVAVTADPRRRSCKTRRAGLHALAKLGGVG